jgi:xylulokinase
LLSVSGYDVHVVPKLLGIDIGTSGCKVVLIDENGSKLGEASAEYPLLVPQPMWSEQNPEDWWKGVQRCLIELDPRDVDAIGVTGQMHGSVFLDENGEVIRPALLWNDQRTVAECQEIEAKIGADRLKELTCNPALTGFQLPKILWLRNHEPDNFARLRQVLLPKDYIRYKLTGEYATEVSDASGTGAFDVATRTWSAEVLQALDLPASLFPKVYESDEVTGKTSKGVPVVGGGGDQAAAAVGTGAVEPGVISVSLGTSGVVFTSIPSASYHKGGAAHTFCHANRSWHAMGVMLSCGGALKWYRDTFGAGRSYDQISESASKEVAGCQGLSFLPYLTGERCPHNDPFARSVFYGATLANNLSSFDRATFEGITFGLFEGFELLKSLGAEAREVRVTSGGSKSDFWMQMIADVFGVPCQRLEVDEGPALGAAILAGVGIGVWGDVATACREIIKTKQVFSPSGTDYRPAFEQFQKLYRATSTLPS